MRVIIVDTSCLILFKKIDELQVIESTFRQAITTDKVIEEYGDIVNWLVVRNDYDRNSCRKLKNRFGEGESSCIALAQYETNPLLIIDDRKARNIAEEIGIECVGSLGVLLIAKREGAIKTVKPILEKIQRTNFRLTSALIEQVIKMADEY
jgi:predicted nucleic acid-binding protein